MTIKALMLIISLLLLFFVGIILLFGIAVVAISSINQEYLDYSIID